MHKSKLFSSINFILILSTSVGISVLICLDILIPFLELKYPLHKHLQISLYSEFELYYFS